MVSDTGKIFLTYYAKAINIVAGGNGQKANILGDIQNVVDGSKNLAIDLDENKSVTINQQKLYNIGLYKDYGIRSIEIDVQGKGFQLYTFTFG